MAGRVGAEAGQVDDGVFGYEAIEFVVGGAHQQRPDELVVPGELVDHADTGAVFGLRAAEQVGDKQIAPVRERRHEVALERGEMVRRHAGVVVPPDRPLGLVVADDELVLRAASGVLAGFHHQWPIFRQPPFGPRERALDQRFGRKVGVNGCICNDALVGKRMRKRGSHA